MTKSPNKKTLREADYKRSTKSPRSYLRYFERVSFARNLAQIHVALVDLVPRLLRRGQSPEAVANDLSQLASVNGLSACVAPVVNELAMREAAR